MAINRRQFLGFSAATLFAGPIRLLHANNETRLLSCWTDSESHHYVSLINTHGITLFDVQLPTRGHGITVNKHQNLAAVFSRRPGDFVWVIDLINGQVVEKITASKERHFYGHGVYTSNQHYLLCTENAYESGQGCIGIYDTQNHYQRIGELSSHGIGPHEIKLLSDDKTLVIANGGIKTHPDSPRVKSNLDTMKPNLSYLDIRSGKLLEQVEPPEKWHQLSIRHLDVAPNDSVAVAMQYQGRPKVRPPLIATHQLGTDLNLLTAPDKIQRKMKNYCGSITFSDDGSQFAVSSPRGNLVTYWDITGLFLGFHQQEDACGISQNRNGFFVSDGTGLITNSRTNFDAVSTIKLVGHRWDNHMVSLL